MYRQRDRLFLTAASRLLPRERWSVLLVRPQTLLRWHRELVRRKWTFARRRSPGRLPIDPELGEAVRRIARENPRWGYLRIKVLASSTKIAGLKHAVGKRWLNTQSPRGPTFRVEGPRLVLRAEGVVAR
jgi:hypothetical protein